ncbi:MAG: polysaccharide deacetylase family protein, partial [Treponema sp.]|nr:polysaccharide deacetylase family protein [Treponema sp.]
MKKTVAFFLLIFSFSFIFTQASFSGLDLNSKNQLLFGVSHKAVTEESYNSLFLYELEKKMQQSTSAMINSNPKLITCFPQSLEVLENASVLQIRNRYCTAHYDVKNKSLRWTSLPQEIVENSESFIPLLNKKLDAVSVSPDGKWICFIKQTSASFGKLILKESKSGSQYILADEVEFSFEEVPVLWSPDSTVLTYEKKGMLYFLNLKNSFSIKQIPENYRQIGEGKISSLCWASHNLLIYISKEIVYAIKANELYTRALYSDLVGTGKIIGRLPYAFNYKSDKFWTSENGLSLIMVQDNRTLWYMELDGMDFSWVKTLFSYPFINIPGTALSFNVFWVFLPETYVQIPIIWIEQLHGGKTESYVYKLIKNEKTQSAYFENLSLNVHVKNPKLSPNKKLISFMSEDSLHIYDLSTWTQKFVLSNFACVSYEWITSSEMFIGGKETVAHWDMQKNQINHLFLSQAVNYSWDILQSEILAKNSFGTFSYKIDKSNWTLDTKKIVEQKNQNEKYRVFIGPSFNVDFENALFARHLTAQSSNAPLFNAGNSKSKYYKPRVAIVFDALESSDGLTSILNSLAKYNLKLTFFINGEFLRRFPNAVQEIVEQKHECASMFYTPFTLDTVDFKIDETFIRRGLARNEDDFYEITGSELALYWHTPDYYVNEIIKNASKNSGYYLIQRSFDIKDTITLEDGAKGLSKYNSSGEIIEYSIKNLKDGDVIPVSVGLSSGTRSDYLYEKLDLLINGILSMGFDIVPVS